MQNQMRVMHFLEKYKRDQDTLRRLSEEKERKISFERMQRLEREAEEQERQEMRRKAEAIRKRSEEEFRDHHRAVVAGQVSRVERKRYVLQCQDSERDRRFRRESEMNAVEREARRAERLRNGLLTKENHERIVFSRQLGWIDKWISRESRMTLQ